MKQTIKLIALSVLLLLSALVLKADQYGDFTYTSDGTDVTITGYTGTNLAVTIPDNINGQPVTSIGSWAFSDGNLTNVTIGTNVTSIGDAAFYGCINLASITIPSSVTNIGSGTFNSCLSLTSVAIPASVASIGDYAFFYCTNLSAIAVDAANPSYSSADGVLFNKDQTTLIQFPFGKAGSYSIPSTVTSIGDEAFGIEDHGNPLNTPPSCTGLTNLIIPGGVTNIEDYAFSHCIGLTSVTLSNGITSIGVEAFSWCSQLTSLTIPSSVTSIGEVAFYYSGLTNITIPGSVTNFGLGAFAVCTSLTSVTLQDGVTSIGEAGFNFCTNLNSITIPDSVTSIGERAFWFCTGLTNATIASNVTNIGQYAFSGCSSLINITVNADNASYSSVDGVLCNKDQTALIQFPGGRGGSYTIPSSVTCIGNNAFGSYVPSGSAGLFIFFYPYSCVNLTNITIPSSVTTIGDGAFVYLNNLTSVYFEGNAPVGEGDLNYDFNATVYYLPGTTGWDSFGNVATALWLLPNPTILNFEPNFGVQPNGFGFTISWATNIPVVVEACTNLTNPVWQPVQTNALTDGSAYFSDPQWTNYPGRFYRLRSP
jgi:hypothetical protein